MKKKCSALGDQYFQVENSLLECKCLNIIWSHFFNASNTSNDQSKLEYSLSILLGASDDVSKIWSTNASNVYDKSIVTTEWWTTHLNYLEAYFLLLESVLATAAVESNGHSFILFTTLRFSYQNNF